MPLIKDLDVSSGDRDDLRTVICRSPGVLGFLYVLMGTFPNEPVILAGTFSLHLGTGVLLSMFMVGVTHSIPPWGERYYDHQVC